MPDDELNLDKKGSNQEGANSAGNASTQGTASADPKAKAATKPKRKRSSKPRASKVRVGPTDPKKAAETTAQDAKAAKPAGAPVMVRLTSNGLKEGASGEEVPVSEKRARALVNAGAAKRV